jgi:hypothetical protein
LHPAEAEVLADKVEVATMRHQPRGNTLLIVGALLHYWHAFSRLVLVGAFSSLLAFLTAATDRQSRDQLVTVVGLCQRTSLVYISRIEAGIRPRVESSRPC